MRSDERAQLRGLLQAVLQVAGRTRRGGTGMTLLIIAIVALFFGIAGMIGKLIYGKDWDNDD